MRCELISPITVCSGIVPGFAVGMRYERSGLSSNASSFRTGRLLVALGVLVRPGMRGSGTRRAAEHPVRTRQASPRKARPTRRIAHSTVDALRLVKEGYIPRQIARQLA